ncbi:MAG: UbiA family prenyltransferase [Fuerstiella sp.]|nr:UbiA family prenyltransferase [Fuerstiella sp.]
MLNWLQLLRIPTVFTALADVLCGYFLGAAHESTTAPNAVVLLCLLISSAGLYLGGMVLNDVFDAKLDAVERPERPVPDGRISLFCAAVAGTILMITGLLTSAGAWLAAGRTGQSLYVACLIATAVLLYDAFLKSTWAGPAGMAGCRFLNLSLGASTAVSDTGIAMAWELPVLGASTGLAVYIIGVTWFARNEAGNASRSGLIAGLIVATTGVCLSAGAVLLAQKDPTTVWAALLQFTLIAGVTVVRGITAIRDGQSPILQRTVGRMLLWIIVLDAVVVFASTGSVFLEGIILLLVIPAIVLRRWIPMS